MFQDVTLSEAKDLSIKDYKYIDSSFATPAENDTSKTYCANFRDTTLQLVT
jgi:hypothetical protein